MLNMSVITKIGWIIREENGIRILVNLLDVKSDHALKWFSLINTNLKKFLIIIRLRFDLSDLSDVIRIIW